MTKKFQPTDILIIFSLELLNFSPLRVVVTVALQKDKEDI